ncbi:hypothetical protein [Hallella mizrahii]|uniref:Uncharacterized protein n=1 Tax=Hallella mizrahii TaxID=2606637 RepID=A0A7K0KEV7_9BACT|nr:hypothetical protein [Hallella mizrahii]MST84476.1 hypothetical protein [Hallella mizrahii]
MNNDDERARLIARQIRELVKKLQVMGRDDLLLQAITLPTLEQLRTEAARGTLRRLIVKRDGRFFLEGNKNIGNGSNNTVEVQLSPVHRAVYLLFLRHEEGIEFKRLSEYHDELLSLYDRICPEGDQDKKRETVERLTNPLDNAINEKCSRIKSVFTSLMDDYSASYYIISSQSKQFDPTSPRRWFRRLKVITLPRNLVVYEM